MADGTTTISEPMPQTRLDPQRMAWGVLLISFAIFCTICVISGIGVNYFLFQSSISMDSVVQVGRGSVSLGGLAVRDVWYGLPSGAVLSTDPESQTTVFFRDAQRDERLIASVTLRGNTRLTVWRASRPRFDWGTGAYNIELRDPAGEIDVFVPQDLDRDFRLTIRSAQGALIDLSSSGQYHLTATDSQLQVINRQGQAVLTPVNANVGRSVPVDNQGIINSDNPSEVMVSLAYSNLLRNSTFEEIFTPQGGTQGLTEGWACTNPPTQPPGSYLSEVQDGRLVLRLLRAENAITNGETRCVTWFPGEGYDVRNASTLILRASFNIQYQSLSTCGFEGSECPIMVEIDYIDQRGEGHRWYHGFYYSLEPERDFPLRCSSCTQAHEIVREKAWYAYVSDNLFSLFPVDERPASIVNVQFYASGHQYDVYVGEVALLVG